MRSISEIEEFILNSKFRIIESRGEQPRYIFISDNEHDDYKLDVRFIQSLVQPRESMYFEGAKGVIKKHAEGLFFCNDKKKIRLYTSMTQGPKAYAQNTRFNSFLLCLLSKDVYVEFNDISELFEKQRKLSRDVYYEKIKSEFNHTNQASAYEKEFMEIVNQRSDYMIKRLLSDKRNASYQLVGNGHLNNHWYSKFTNENKNFATIEKTLND